MTWQTAHGYCWARAMRMLGERSWATLTGVLVAAIALALPGFALLVALTAGPLLDRIPAAEATAYVVQGTVMSEVKALGGRLQAIDGVARVRLIPRDQAWADVQRRAGDGQAFADVKPNPLPDAVVAEFAPRASPAVVSAGVAAIRKQPRVESVQADLEWYTRLVAILQVASSLLVPIVGIVALLVIVVALWLVRLLALIERDELRLLEQIGAEADFIRRPFVYAGAVVLGLAASAGLGVLAVGRLLANQRLAEPGRLFGLELGLSYPPWPLVVAFVAGCVLLGAAAGNYSAGRQIASAKPVA